MPNISGVSNIDADLVSQIIRAMRRYELRWQRRERLTAAERSELERDSVELSGAAQAEKTGQPAASSAGADNLDVRISDLIKRLQELRTAAGADGAAQQTEVVFQEEVHTEISASLEVYEPVEGLVVRNQHLAETDEYKFEFIDGSTFKITDKSTGKSTTIWGDPHVDTSDEEGSSNGDFQDLKESKTQTTFILRDNTRVTFTARDEGLIQKVDIFKGSQHLSGIGAESKDFKPETGLFAKAVDDKAASYASSIPVGDVVYAGGDGNDWYNSARQLVWGKTTGMLAGPRPDALFQFSYQQTITQQLIARQVNLAG